MTWKDYLPDFKKSLTGFYEESVKPTVEQKSTEFKNLVQTNMTHGQRTQKAVVAILLAVFLLLALALFWSDSTQGVQWKYLMLGGLMGGLIPFLASQKILKD